MGKESDEKLGITVEREDGHIYVEVTDPSKNEKDKQKSKTEDSQFTIAGYTPAELLKAPLEPPDPKKVGKRSPRSK